MNIAELCANWFVSSAFHSCIAFASVLLGCCCVFVAVHGWTATRAGTKLPYEINVVPQTGSLTIAPGAIATAAQVTEGSREHKRAVFQESRMGVLYEPNPWVKVNYDPLAPKKQGVSEM